MFIITTVSLFHSFASQEQRIYPCSLIHPALNLPSPPTKPAAAPPGSALPRRRVVPWVPLKARGLLHQDPKIHLASQHITKHHIRNGVFCATRPAQFP